MFFLLASRNTAQMQAKCIFEDPGPQKARNLASWDAVSRPLLSSYARQENTVKTMVFGTFWFSWGLAPPPPPEPEGLCNQVVFTPQTTKLPATVAYVSLFFTKLLQLILLQICSETNWCFYEKHAKPCKLQGKTQFWQKAARGKIDTDRILHLLFTVKSHFACLIS